MMKKNSAKKEKKDPYHETVTVSEEIVRNFFLGDLLFTILPLTILILLRVSFGTLNLSFLFISEWPYTSIIISSLALIRLIELKVFHQKDTSHRVLIIAVIGVLLVVFSTLSLVLYTLNAECGNVISWFIVAFQFILLITSLFILYLAHSEREHLLFAKKKFPKDISAREFHWYLSENLKDARENIIATCAALNKDYDFVARKEDVDNITEYEKQEIIRLVENMQGKLGDLYQRMEKWEKPPYSRLALPEEPDDSKL